MGTILEASPYAYGNQPITATALIQQVGDDSFYYPEQNGHTGYAADGSLYANGTLSSPPQAASWFSEPPGPYRGASPAFPPYGLILLGRASMAILDESTPALAPWMTFLLQDGLMLGNNISLGNPNFAGMGYLMGFTPSGLAYANGVVSVIYAPDPGATDIEGSPPVYGSASTMVISVDFSKDTAYCDLAV